MDRSPLRSRALGRSPPSAVSRERSFENWLSFQDLPAFLGPAANWRLSVQRREGQPGVPRANSRRWKSESPATLAPRVRSKCPPKALNWKDSSTSPTEIKPCSSASVTPFSCTASTGTARQAGCLPHCSGVMSGKQWSSASSYETYCTWPASLSSSTISTPGGGAKWNIVSAIWRFSCQLPKRNSVVTSPGCWIRTRTR